MNHNRMLWTLVILDIFLAFASAGAEGFFGWTLPPALAEYARHRFSRTPGPPDAIPFALLAITVLSAFGAWIGLLSYWRFARRLYLFSCAAWMLHTLIAGPSVRTSVGAMFSGMNGLVGGAIIGLVYFSDLARRYERSPVRTGTVPDVRVGAGAGAGA